MTKKPKYPQAKPRKAQGESVKAHPPSDFVPNVGALAKALGVAAVTIKAWKRIEGCPVADTSGRHKVSEWVDWVSKRKGSTPDEQMSKAGLEMEILKVKLEDKRMELEQKKGILVLRADMIRDIHSSVFAFRTEIESIPGKLAPQVVGLTIAEAELRIASAVQEALMKLHRGEWASK